MLNTYIDLVEGAASAPPTDLVITIPHGFTDEEQEDESAKRQQMLQKFEKQVLEIALAARD